MPHLLQAKMDWGLSEKEEERNWPNRSTAVTAANMAESCGDFHHSQE